MSEYRISCKEHGVMVIASENDLCPLCPPSHSEQALDMVAPEPTKLTRDQAIRARALEVLASLNSGIAADIDTLVDFATTLEDYIRDGRKGDE